MIPKEAINTLNYLCKGITTLNTLEGITTAIKALEKQIPQRPNFEGDGYDENGYLIYDTWICPCCEERYEVDYEEHKHCPNCGQAIDWSNTE